MFKRLAAIGFIFVCTSIAWAILAATIYSRTSASGSSLRGRVESVWGSELTQQPPVASVQAPNAAGVIETHLLPLMRSDLRVKLALQPRQKGLLWFSTYSVSFEGVYSLANDTGRAVQVRLAFPLPAKKAVYDGLTILRDGQPIATENRDGALLAYLNLDLGQALNLQVSYRS